MPFFNYQRNNHRVTRFFPSITSHAFARRGLQFTFYGALSATIAYSLYYLHYESQREHEITSTPYGKDTQVDIKNIDEFELGPRPIHGSLESRIVTDKNTGDRFIKKGAHSADTLKKEFMYSRFLHAAFPNSQPQSYFVQKKLGENEARFYTLSTIYLNSMDLEEFIRQPNWRDLIVDKKVLYLDRALTLDGLLAKQQDTKYANLVIREFATHYEIISIDHEFAFGTTLVSERPILTHDPIKLISMLKDLQNPDTDRVIGLQGEIVAHEFIDAVFDDMSTATIYDTYQKVAETDTKPIINTCRLYAASGTLFALADCEHYEKKFDKIKKLAREFNEQQTIPNHATFKRN